MQTTVSSSTAQTWTAPAVTPDPATRGSRLLAVIVDMAVAIAAWIFSFLTASAMFFIVSIIALAVVQIVLLSSRGQSIGKVVLGIKIVKFGTGNNGGFVPNVLVRVILNGIIGIIPLYALVDILFIFRQDRRCLHDLIAGTEVVQA
jgi:uncharacterized RDD family membrane protein YckC